MKTNIIINTMAVLLCGTAAAQQTGVQAQNAAPQQSQEIDASYSTELSFFADLDAIGVSTNDADSEVERFLREQGLQLGLNENGLYIAQGSAAFSKKPTDKAYELDRHLTFQEAMADAKRSIANMYGQEVSRRMESIYEKPESRDSLIKSAKEEAGIDTDLFDKLAFLADSKIDEELAKINKDRNSPEAKDIAKKLLSSSSMSDFIERTSIQQVGGLVALKIFEAGGNISVLTYYSPNTAALAGAMNGHGTMPEDAPKMDISVQQWIDGFKLSDLYLAQGVQLRIDQKGNLVLVAFGISSTPSKHNNDIKATKTSAETVATGNLRSFAGEMIMASATEKITRESLNYGYEQDESISEVEQATKQKIEAIASKITISGIIPIKTWSFTDPRSNTTVCGAVCTWSIPSANWAIREKDKLKDLLTPGEGLTEPLTKPTKNDPTPTNGPNTSNTGLMF